MLNGAMDEMQIMFLTDEAYNMFFLRDEQGNEHIPVGWNVTKKCKPPRDKPIMIMGFWNGLACVRTETFPEYFTDYTVEQLSRYWKEIDIKSIDQTLTTQNREHNRL